MNFKIAICLIAFLLFGQTYTYSQEQFPHVQGDILVRIKDQHSIAWVVQDLEWHKGLSTQIQARELLSKHMNIWRFTFNKDIISHSTMLDMILRHPSVHNAQLNYIMQKRLTPNDPSYNQQWQYEQNSDFDLDAAAAWNITTGGVTALGDTIVVCVVDDGLQVSHPDWGDNIWRNWGEINGNGVDDDGNGYIDDYRGWNADANNNNIVATGFATHGTPVAGIVAAKGNNGVGVSGVNWNVKLMFVVGGGTAAEAITAYTYPLECRKLYNQTNGALGAFVVSTNSSWGVDNQQCVTYAPLVNELYDTLGTYGVLSAAATANANTNVDVQGDFPTSCSSNYLVSVTNMNQLGNKVNQAGYGTTTIDLGAYGEGTYTIATGSSYAGFGGTSGATPHVAGAIGLLYSAPCQRLALLARTQPAQTALMIKQIILNSAVDHSTLAGVTVSGGVLNLKNALDSVMAIGCSLAGCHEPYNIASSSTVGTTALVNWDRVDSTTLYHVMYRQVGTSTWTTTTASDTFLTINGLTACTNYEVQIASNCDTTSYSAPYTFKTGDCCYAPATITPGQINITDASFSWNGDPFVTTYTIEYKLQSASVWSSITTTNTSITLTNLDSCVFYEMRIISTCPVNVNNQYSATIPFETVGCGKCTSTSYCASVGQVSDDDWLERVTFENINNTSGNNGGYVSFVNGGPTTDVAQGGSYPITVEIGYNTGNWATNWRLKVWIDFNQDETFDNATEVVYDAGQISTATAIHTGTVNIPATATLSRTRMRVSMRWGTSALNPCSNPNYGEIEDYCINITTPTATNNVSAITNSTLNVYPNPFDNQLMLDVNSTSNQESVVIVRNLTGQELVNFTKTLSQGQNTLRLSGKDLPQGMYLVTVLLEDGSVLTQKVVKE